MAAVRAALTRVDNAPSWRYTDCMTPDLSAQHLSRFLLDTYEGGSFIERLMLRYRPYICPFDEVLRRVPAGARVLDMGCGIGYLCALTAANCAPSRVLGIDVNADAIH